MVTIYHAFDTTYQDIISQLNSIKQNGYTHIQTSPSQKSRITIPKSEPNTNDLNAWWFCYQPTEFVIGNKYGSKNDLKELVDAANKLNIKIISDLCLNFMAELDGISRKDWDQAELKAKHDNNQTLLNKYIDTLDKSFPSFTKDDFKTRYYYNEHSKRRVNNWFMGNLPALKLENKKVQIVHDAYIKSLLDIGIAGFRFDCSLWMSPEIVSQYLQMTKQNNNRVINYLEVIEQNNYNIIKKYAEIAPITDYNLAQKLASIFEMGSSQWVRDLGSMEFKIKSLSKNNITFAVNHDTFHSKQSHISIKFPNNSEYMATAVLLSLKNGIPLILNKISDNEIIKNGVKYRSALRNSQNEACLIIPSIKTKYYIVRINNCIILERGSDGFFLMNRGFETVKMNSVYLDWESRLSGVYKKINSEQIIKVGIDGQNRVITGITKIDPQSGCYFVKVSDNLGVFKVPEPTVMEQPNINATKNIANGHNNRHNGHNGHNGHYSINNEKKNQKLLKIDPFDFPPLG
jgi:hypothetical protein